MKKRLGLFLLLLSSTFISYATPTFVVGQDYKVLDTSSARGLSKTAGAISVKEFFSYGCPWCFKLEPELKKWKETLPKKVYFERIPVVFEAGWDVYAKAFYASSLLGIESGMSSAIFDEVQEKEKKLDNNQAMINFFVKNGVSDKIAQSAFLSSPTIDAKVVDGIQQMQALQVNSVPSFVINNRYKVDIAMMEGDANKLFRVIGFLIAKELVAEMHK